MRGISFVAEQVLNLTFQEVSGEHPPTIITRPGRNVVSYIS
jgi:PHD/YefM family antitoxin component YafN of YafNO toxin-antitoxin module